MGNVGIKVLAVASGGGHWEQLMMLHPTLMQYDTRFVTTEPAVAAQHGIGEADTLPDCSQNMPLASARCALAALWVVMKHRPQVIVSTGAAPGFFCILAGRLIGTRTLWIDSVANGEQLSMCGKLSRLFAHQCWTQWEHLSGPQTARYRGAVL